MPFHAFLPIRALSIIMKVLAEPLSIDLYIFPSIGVLRLRAVVLLIVLLWLVLMAVIAIFSSVVVLPFWSSLMMAALIIVVSPSIVIRDFLNRMVVVAIVGGKELASGTVFALLFVLQLCLLHVNSCIIIIEFI